MFSKCRPPFEFDVQQAALIDVIGAEPSYKSKLLWETLQRGVVAKSTLLTHEIGGPVLQVECREFVATSADQTQLFWKEETGWKWIYTTAYTLKTPTVDLSSYVDDFSSFYLKMACEKADYLGQIFQLARLYRKVRVSTTIRFEIPF